MAGNKKFPAGSVLQFRYKYHHVLSQAERKEFLANLTPLEAFELQYTSEFWLRTNQIVDGDDWLYYVIMAGRGFGKTKAGACWTKKMIESNHEQVAIIGPTHKDLLQVMIPAIQAEYPPSQRPEFNKTTSELHFANGKSLFAYSAETEVRGPNVEKAWCDELPKWWNADQQFETLSHAVRIGNPQILITTTPKKGIKTLKALQGRALSGDKSVKIVTGSTFDNKDNLNERFINDLKRYEGLRKYRQEVMGELLDDSEDALWSEECINANRVPTDSKLSPWLPKGVSIIRIVIAVDPAGTANPDSDETGIIVCALGNDGHGYVLEDCSGRYTPDQWARKAIKLYHLYQANSIIAEKNFGGDMVALTLKTVDPSAHVKIVTATRGKYIRAEPVAAKYAQNMVHHVGSPNRFQYLEDQLTAFTGMPSDSRRKDDRLDALVWGLSELLITPTYRRPLSLYNLPKLG